MIMVMALQITHLLPIPDYRDYNLIKYYVAK